MSEDRLNALDVLRNAIEMEIEGKNFFERASEHVKHQRAKDTFMSLIKQEQRHLDIISEELRRLEKGETWASLDRMKRTAPAYPKISVFHDEEVKHYTLDPGSGELEVLKMGIEVEKRSIEYYRSASSSSDEPKAKELFNWLVGEESGHLTILSSEYDYRTKSGFYYDNAEFSLEVM